MNDIALMTYLKKNFKSQLYI